MAVTLWSVCSRSTPDGSFGSTIEIREEKAVVVAQWGCARTRGSELSTYPLRAVVIFLESQVACAVSGG